MTATYRLQLHAEFTFADAERQVRYLADLGVTHLYLSPVLQAVTGSQHGYDVVDHSRVNEELGGGAGLSSLARTARAHGLGIVVDVVPNHMALVAPEHVNRPLWQVLREGPEAPTAHWFDVDWKTNGGRLGLPVLGGTLEEALHAGELTLDEHDGEPVLRYFDHVFPLAQGTEGDDVAAVLARQHYLLASWRDTDTVLNYRRFFDVDQLIAVRVELPDVFEATHRLLLDLNHDGVIDGFRIDHPDGLADPEGYLHRLREASRPGTLVWVEKILEGDERLPSSWACDGTTGYDAIRAVSAALVDPAAAKVLDQTWANAGGDPDMEHTVDLAKRQVVAELLGAELGRLTRRAVEALPDQDPARLEDAVVELLVAGDVYRAYIRPNQSLTPLARARLDDALAVALGNRPDLREELELLTGLAKAENGQPDGAHDEAENGQPDGAHDEAAAVDFAVRLQQTWGPVMAKGVEDTTFYRWHRLVALNEVGGEPTVLEHADPQLMHDWAVVQQEAWPRGLTALSTHDTKRSEDVRARLLAVAGDTASWIRCSEVFAAEADRIGVDRPTGHLLWQTLVGVGEISRDRLHGYLPKAVREAKLRTAWVDGDEEYEARVLELADRAIGAGPMRDAVDAAVADNTEAIRATVLGQKLLQLLLPGIPDVYQGCELVDLSLVDPDNRRPVDYRYRARCLGALAEGTPAADLDGEKLLVTVKALQIRQARPEAFGERGSYQPLTSSTEHALGFLRSEQVGCVVTRAPRRLADAGGWGEETVALPTGRWRDELTGRTHDGGEVHCADLLGELPVALLSRAADA